MHTLTISTPIPSRLSILTHRSTSLQRENLAKIPASSYGTVKKNRLYFVKIIPRNSFGNKAVKHITFFSSATMNHLQLLRLTVLRQQPYIPAINSKRNTIGELQR